MAIKYAFDLYPRAEPKDGPRVRRLSHLQSAEYRADGGTNSGSISLRATSPDGADIDPEGLQYIRVVRINTAVVDGGTLSGFSEAVVGGFFLENGDYKALSEKSEKLLTFKGAGTLSYLDRAIMAHQSYLTDPFIGHHPFDDRWRLWAAGTGNELGAILWRVIRELQEAGRPQNPIPDLTLDFTYLVDSNAAPWVQSSGDFEAQVGERVLMVVKRLMEMGLWVEMDPDTFELRAYEPGTHARDRTGGAWGANVIRFQAPSAGTVPTGNIKSDATRGLGALIRRSDLMVGANDVYEWHNAVDVGVSLPTAFVWEGSYRVEDASAASFEDVATQQLQARADAGDVVRLRGKLGNSPATGYYLPFEHVRVDDIATLDTGSGAWDWDETEQKVAAVSILLREGGDWDFLVDLGSQYNSIDSRAFAIAPVGAHSHPMRLCDPTQLVRTSQDWRSLDISWSGGSLNSEPAGWQDVGFDDSAWEAGYVPPDPNSLWFDIANADYLSNRALRDDGHLEDGVWITRHEFELEDVPTADVVLIWSCDDTVQGWLNGTQIIAAGSGGTTPGGQLITETIIPVAEFVAGTNCLAFKVTNGNKATDDWLNNPTMVQGVMAVHGTGGIAGTSSSAARCDHGHLHNDLHGRSVAGTHPAAAVGFTPAGSIAATNVQDAIEEVAAEAGGGTGLDWYIVTDPAYGAVLDGTTNDAAAVQAAIDAAEAAGGGVVYFPEGICQIGSTLVIDSDDVTLRGAGSGASIIRAAAGLASSDVIQITSDLCNVIDLQITSASQKTGGVGISFSTASYCSVDRVRLHNQYDSIKISGGVVVRITNTDLRETKHHGIWITGTGNDYFIGKVVADNPSANATGSGIHIDCTGNGATWVDHSDFIHFADGLKIAPASGQTEWHFFTGCAFDNSTNDGAVLGGGGGAVYGVSFDNSWVASNGRYGLNVGSGVEGLNWVGGKFLANGEHGANLGAGEKISISNALIIGNGQDTSNTYDGIRVAAGVVGLVLSGNIAGNGLDTSATQRYGVSFAAGATDHVQLVGNDFSDNLSGAINGLAGVTGTDLVTPSILTRVHRSTNQTISNTTVTAISWSHEQWDDDGMWVSGTPTRLTCNTTGIYKVTCSVLYASTSASGTVRQLRLHKNGAEYSTRIVPPAVPAGLTHSDTLKLVAGDYIEWAVYQDRGGTLDIVANSGTTIFASALKVG